MEKIENSDVKLSLLPIPAIIIQSSTHSLSNKSELYGRESNQQFNNVFQVGPREINNAKTLSQKLKGLKENIIQFNGSQDGSWHFRYYNNPINKWFKVDLKKIRKDLYLLIFNDITELEEQIEQLKKEKEEKFLMNDLIREGICVHRNGYIEDVNKAILHILGYEKSDLLGGLIFDFVHPDSIKDAKETFEQDKTLPYQAKIRCKDGNYKKVEIEARTIVLENDTIRVLSVRDLTEKIENEKNLSDTLKLYKRIAENMTDVIWTTDLQLKTTYISPSVKNVLGFTPEEFLQKDVMQLYPPEVLESLTSILKEELAKENQPGIDPNRNRLVNTPHLKSNGEIMWASQNVSFIRNEKGEVTGLLGVMRDISEIKNMQNQLTESEKKYRLLVENMSDILYKVDKKGRLTYVSPLWTKILGHKVEEIQGKTIDQIIHPDDVEQSFIFMFDAFKSGKRAEGIEYRIKNKLTGEWRWHTTSASPIVLENGEIEEYIGITRDITDVKQAREDLIISKNLYQESIDNNTDLIFVKDENLRYVEVNKALAAFFNLPKEYIIGKDDIQLMGKEKGEVCNATDRNAILAGKPMMAEEEINDLVFETMKFPIKLGVNRTGLVGFIRDITEKRDLSREIREKTKLLQNITDNMFDMVSLTDLKGNFLYSTKSHHNIGYDPSDFKGKNVFEFVHPDDIPFVMKKFEDSIQKGKQDIIEYRFRKKNGDYFWVETMGKILVDQKGNPESLLFSSRDINQRKELEESLRESQLYLEVMLDNPFESIWSIDKDRRLRYINNYFKRAFKGSFGVDLQKGVNVQDQLPDEELAKEWATRYERVFNGEKFIFEESYDAGDNFVTAEIAANPIYKDGEIEGACFYGRDITDRKMAEEKIKYLSDLQNLIMTIASDYINLDIDKVDQAVNESLESMGRFVKADRAYIFEYDWEEMHASNIFEWCETGISPEIDNLQKVPLSEMKLWVEVHKKKETIFIENVDELDYDDPVKQLLEPQGISSLIAIPVISNGDCCGFVGFDWVNSYHVYSDEERNLLWVYSQVFTNLKNRQNLEQTLIREKENANTANRAKSEFLANISHEIRTPMNSILGFSEVMLNTAQDEKQKNYVKTILDSGKTLLSLINDILDLSKIEAGRIEISPEPVDLRIIISEISQLFHHKLEEKGLDLNVHIQEEFPRTIVIDEVRIRQILLNLVGNAIKFTEQGSININVCIMKDKNGSVDFAIAVKDTGIGIAPEQHDFVFESFHQSSGQDVRKYGGTGLGLPISKRLTELMRGNISLESEPGKGSTFTIELRDVKYSDEILQSSELYNWDEHSVVFSKTSVMVVDDVPHNRKLVKTYLEEYDLDVYEVENGEMAIESAKAYKPGIIFMDIRMPGMNGYEATEMIKNDKSLSNIPIVALTASTMQSELEKITDLFDGYLRKPVQKKSLVSEMTRFLKHEESKAKKMQHNVTPDKVQEYTTLVVDQALAKEFNEKFMAQINGQLNFVTLDEINLLITHLDDFATEKKILPLKKCTDKLREASESFDFDIIQEQLEQIRDLFNNKLKGDGSVQ